MTDFHDYDVDTPISAMRCVGAFLIGLVCMLMIWGIVWLSFL